MRRTWMRIGGAAMLALTLGLWGCENLSEPTSPLAPSEQDEVLIIENKRGFTIARETDPEVGVVSAVIDQKGGSLNIGVHTLVVPKGAVDAPTTFTMTKFPGEIKMGLTATRVTPNDVGHAGFNKAVYLTLSFAKGETLPNEDQARVVWLRPDGTMEAQPSNVNKRKREVTGHLKHFSDYGIGFPNTGGGDDW